MKYDDAAIPAGCAWSSPFARWQGSLAEIPSAELAADVTGRALAQRGFDVAAIEEIVPGLFAGCAAGDTGAALVVRVDD